MFLTNVRINRAPAKPFVPRRSSILPCALSMVLATQCLSLNMLQLSSAAWAAEDMPEAAAPSWTEATTDSTKTIDAVIGGTPSAAATKLEKSAPESEKSSGDGKSIAEATHVGGSTTADAAILTPAQLESKLESKEDSYSEPAKSGTAGDATVVDSDASTKETSKPTTVDSSTINSSIINSSATNSSSALAPGGVSVETPAQNTIGSAFQPTLETTTAAPIIVPITATDAAAISAAGTTQPVTDAILAAPSASALLAPAPIGANLMTTPAAAEPGHQGSSAGGHRRCTGHCRFALQ